MKYKIDYRGLEIHIFYDDTDGEWRIVEIKDIPKSAFEYIMNCLYDDMTFIDSVGRMVF